jgi:HD-GYP domain-containing protein (c-di-GMP phosphodiesterase class II)
MQVKQRLSLIIDNTVTNTMRSRLDSDEISLSSTFTVEHDIKKELHEPCQQKKRVCFDLDSTKEHENTSWCKEDCIDAWYVKTEYRQFKVATYYMAKEIAKSEARNKAPFSYHRIMTRAYQVCCETVDEVDNAALSIHEKRHLVRWAEVATSRLGLEKWSVKSIQSDKSGRRKELVELVKDLQSIPLLEKEAMPRDEFIRQSCQRLTRPSRLFARCLAEAQAKASQSEC